MDKNTEAEIAAAMAAMEGNDFAAARAHLGRAAATGQVALCCMDGHAAHPIGDITETHALEIYNGPGYRALREWGVARLDLGRALRYVQLLLISAKGCERRTPRAVRALPV